MKCGMQPKEGALVLGGGGGCVNVPSQHSEVHVWSVSASLTFYMKLWA